MFVSSTPNRVVRVVGLDSVVNGVPHALVTDLRTRNDFRVPINYPSRFRPQIGDVWVVTSELGAWEFDRIIKSAKIPTKTTLAEVLQFLNDLAFIDYVPTEAPSGSAIEAAHAAYIGEVRLFRCPLPSGWIACNGAAISRSTYRLLFESIGTTDGVGDGSTTFNVPNFADLGTAKYAICAH